MIDHHLYYVFKDGVFIGKYLTSEWSKVRADEIFECHVYNKRTNNWYLVKWGSFIPLNDCDIPDPIKLTLMLIPLDQL